MHNSETIALSLRELGIGKGSVVLVHSSLRSLGIEDAAQSLMQGLLLAVGEEGTLLVPALSHATVNAAQNFFDIKTTPSCVGAFTEFFRTQPGVKRSLHPTHSVCGIGKNAKEILSTHHLGNTPCGPESPFAKVRDIGGNIVFIGCGTKSNTSIHGVEETLKPYPPYLFSESIRYTIKDYDEKCTEYDCLRHGFNHFGYAQRYDRIEALLSPSEISRGKVLDAATVVMDAAAVWKKGLEALQKDNLFFVEKTNA